MARNPQLSNAAANAAADAVCDQMDTGYLRIYSGTQPATANTSITSQVLLAVLRFNAAAFAAASAGVATAGAITSDTAAAATGTASWFRAFKSDGSTVMFDGSVGTTGADLNLSTTAIVQNATVAVSSFTYTQNKSS
tara:strand:- start:1915 stop:2325 length:411 start_codon:yes stop_codon:yes gene_type:complete